MNGQLLHPTEQLVQSYIEAFRNNPAMFVSDQALVKLFTQFPTNTALDEVLLKATALNSLYGTNILAIHAVAKRIQACAIDDRLRCHDPGVVEEIACVEIQGKWRRNYSFASKYCSFHQPDAYPIYDQYVDRLLWAYQRQDRFSSFRRYELFRNYPIFKRVVDDFRSHYHLIMFTLRGIDRFLWLYGQQPATTDNDWGG